MKTSGWIVLSLLVVSTMACTITIPRVQMPEPGETQVMEVNVAAPSGEQGSTLNINMGAGKLTLDGDGSGLVSGTIRYSLDILKPVIERNENEVSINQQVEINNAFTPNNYENDWDLALGNTPMDLYVRAGAYEGQFDLSGIPLTGLDIQDGASNVEISFDDPNPEEMSLFNYRTGASNVDMTGLANANFSHMVFNSGAGSYSMDFSGQLQQDANVRITSGVSNLEITVSDGYRTRITLTGGLNNVSTHGTWTVDNDIYETGSGDHLLDIVIDMGVGSLDLSQKS
ncbi:MAG: toast rack family protein [Anaerolineaceae bacterium]|jgi:hypothetical protein|nr:toast rack family protein [Anaerolineaceae bacterium]